jgi:hypothetical protein
LWQWGKEAADEAQIFLKCLALKMAATIFAYILFARA